MVSRYAGPPDKTPEPRRTCDDCGGAFTGLSDRTIEAGSTCREPGEVVCPTCNSARLRLIRQVDALPNRLVRTAYAPKGLGSPLMRPSRDPSRA